MATSIAARTGVTGELAQSLVDGLQDRADARGTLQLLAQAFTKGWISPFDIEARTFKELPTIVARMVRAAEEDGDRRTIARGAEVLKGLAEYNLRLAEALDKSSRLDAGQATDRVEQTHTVTFDKAG